MTPYYSDEAVTIYHGDCREVLTQLDLSRPAELMITDPPYGLGAGRKDGGAWAMSGTPEWRRQKGDFSSRPYGTMEGNDAVTVFDPTFLLPYAKDIVIWGADHFSENLPTSRGWLVWDKREDLASNMLSDAELAWTNFGTVTRIFRHKWLGYMRASEVGYHVHPTQKPVALMRWILNTRLTSGGLVLDPFMGSGPVLRAAKDAGCKAIGIEIEERYCEVAVKRLAQGVLFGQVI